MYSDMYIHQDLAHFDLYVFVFNLIKRFAILGRRNLKIIFNLICIITVGCMAGYWLHKYKITDRDIGVVDYVQIEEAEDEVKLFVTSICFQDPFIEKNLEELSLENNRIG